MGTKREQLGYVIEVKSYRKHGNGAKGGGRQGSSGKKCSLFKLGPGNQEELVATAEGKPIEDLAFFLNFCLGSLNLQFESRNICGYI